MNGILSALLVAHGLAHVVGFLGAFRLGPDAVHTTTLLFDRLEVGESGSRVLGVIWLLLAVAFVVAGLATWSRSHWWPTYTLVVVGLSLGFCLLALPETRIGVPVNVLLLAATLVGTRWGWMVAH